MPFLYWFRRYAYRSAALGLSLALSAGVAQAQAPGSAWQVNELKKLSLEELTQVEVTSVSRRPEKLIGTASAIQVISNREIRRSGFTTIADTLRLADNLNVAQKTPHDWAISARGFNANLGNKLLVLIDGRAVYTPLFSGVFWNAQDYLLEDIDQIEVISGPGGTLWGANAVNGVINIKSKSAKDTLGLYSEFGMGTELESLVGLRYGTQLAPHVFVRAYFKYFGYDDAVLQGGQKASDSWRQGQGGFRLDADPTPEDSFSLHGDYYLGDEELNTGGTARISGSNLVGRWNHVLTADSATTLQVYYDRTYLRDPFAATAYAPAGKLIDNLDTYDVDFQHRFTIGAPNRVVWGLNYRITDDKVKQQAPNFGFLPPRLRQVRYSAFVQDETELLDGLFATVGSKFERNAYTGWEVEPSIRLRRELSATQNVWAAVSRAVRMPSRLDRDVASPLPPLTLVKGSSQFRSEKLIAYELGYRSQLTRDVSGSVSLFYNDYTDLRSWKPTPVSVFPLTFANDLEGRSYGLEFSGDVRITDTWRVHAGYNLLRERIRVKQGGSDFFNGLDETADPQNQFSLRSSVDLRHVEVDLFFRWVDELRVNNNGQPGTVPSYSELNARLAWRVTTWSEVSVVGQNLLHKQHAEFGAPGPQRELIERSLFARVELKF